MSSSFPFCLLYYSLTVYYESTEILAGNMWLFLLKRSDALIRDSARVGEFWDIVSEWQRRSDSKPVEIYFGSQRQSKKCQDGEPRAEGGLPRYIITGQKTSNREPECEDKERRSCRPYHSPPQYRPIQDPLSSTTASSSYRLWRPHLSTVLHWELGFQERNLRDQSNEPWLLRLKETVRRGWRCVSPAVPNSDNSVCIFYFISFLFCRWCLIEPSLFSDALCRQI